MKTIFEVTRIVGHHERNLVRAAGHDLPRAFRTAYLWVNSRCGLPFQIFLTDLLRSPVLKPGVPTL